MVRDGSSTWAAGLLVSAAFASIAFGQGVPGPIRGFLQDRARLSAEEFTALDRGEVVVKILATSDKRETSLVGAVRVALRGEIDLRAFRESFGQRSNKARLNGGPLSDPAVAGDLDGLELEERDIEALKNCAPGSCSLKLSAAMIKAFRTEIDWSASDQKTRAEALLRNLLITYVRDYQQRGDRALIEYHDHRKAVSLADEYKSLREPTVVVSALAPEFEDYLRKYPDPSLPDVENRFDWGVIASGLKPIISITHGTAHSTTFDGFSRYLLVTKQIYASHYVDASLAVAALVVDHATQEKVAYLVFTDASRSESLGGVLGRLARPVVEKEAKERVRELLEVARSRIEASSVSRTAGNLETPATSGGSIVSMLFNRWTVVAAVLVIVAATGLILWKRRR